ncbi:probable methyltransferase PMT23 [Andrographis paniculata]|uniref:probable methyltransferase PMT23 n=1 Tax=Andrographis paniculata TaxID=175694 RepID=UPI0021E7FAA8|nr:probable methyltransferase PMT23 [Andrographis paniculata]
MAISSMIPNFWKEKKNAFALVFFLLLIFLTYLLISDSEFLTEPVSFVSDQRSSLPGGPPNGGVLLNNSSGIANSTVTANETNVGGAVDYSGAVGDDDDDRVVGVEWELCKGSSAVDYIPCLDNSEAIKKLPSRRHMEHRERHCPDPSPRCLVPLPAGYRAPVAWPKSRDMIWYNNVPHPKLVEYKKDQHWVVKSGDYFVFPGGGTQFKNGVDEYINSLVKALPEIELGKKMRVILDVGCGVASFGGAMMERNVLTMSFAPKDEHEAQIQFALERGIPATLSVIGTQKLPFPDNSYDLIHCARCRVHWDGDGGKPLMELNRILRPGGYFVWSATPVYKNNERDQNVWKSMVALTKSICWETVEKTFFESSQIGVVVYQKPSLSACYQSREKKDPPLCESGNKRNSSWYAPLDDCLAPLPEDSNIWPPPWPKRLTEQPRSLPAQPDAAEAFRGVTRHWSALVSEVYQGGIDVNWSSVRNVMDMNAGYGGFAAALINLPVWVMNVVPIHEPDTLPVIFDRGMIGVYHDWCESFNTYPRTYDLLHSSFLLGNVSKRCDLVEVAAEMDRILRPGGYVVVQDTLDVAVRLKPILKSLHWDVGVYRDKFLVCRKGFWRPPAGN